MDIRFSEKNTLNIGTIGCVVCYNNDSYLLPYSFILVNT